MGNEYDFVAIAEEDIDDEIKSLSNEEEEDEERMPMKTELEKSMRGSVIVTNQFANSLNNSFLLNRSMYHKNAQMEAEDKNEGE